MTQLLLFVSFRIECFCGNKKPSSLTELPDKECNMKCPLSVLTGRKVVDYIRSEHESTELYNHSTSSVDPVEGSGKSDQQSCGGFFAMSVYETGVFQGKLLSVFTSNSLPLFSVVNSQDFNFVLICDSCGIRQSSGTS